MVACSEGEQTNKEGLLSSHLEVSPAWLSQDGGQVQLQWKSPIAASLEGGDGALLLDASTPQTAKYSLAASLAGQSVIWRLNGGAQVLAQATVRLRPPWTYAPEIELHSSSQVLNMAISDAGDIVATGITRAAQAGDYKGGADLFAYAWRADGSLRYKQQLGEPGEDHLRGMTRIQGVPVALVKWSSPKKWAWWILDGDAPATRAALCTDGLDDVLDWQVQVQKNGATVVSVLGWQTLPASNQNSTSGILGLRQCGSPLNGQDQAWKGSYQSAQWQLASKPQHAVLASNSEGSQVAIAVHSSGDLGAGGHAQGSTHLVLWNEKDPVVDVQRLQDTSVRILGGSPPPNIHWWGYSSSNDKNAQSLALPWLASQSTQSQDGGKTVFGPLQGFPSSPLRTQGAQSEAEPSQPSWLSSPFTPLFQTTRESLMVMIQQGTQANKSPNSLSPETKPAPIPGKDDDEDAALLAGAPWVRGYRWGDQGPEVQGEFPWILHGFSSLETIAGVAVDPVGDFVLASVGWRQNRRWLRIDRFNEVGEGRGPAHPALALGS